MIEYYLAGSGLRLVQIVVYSSLWIVIGCFIAAVFRRMLGPEKVKRIFADGTSWGLVTGWLIGMLLPVCSLGVIPVVRELHRIGVKRGTIVAFGLTAPLFNPLSVLYGLTLSDPIAILSFSLCALLIVSLLGWIWGRMSANDDRKTPDDEMPAYGIKRSVSILYSTAKETIGPSMIYIVIGILASMVLAISLPKGYLQDQVEVDNPIAPIVVSLIATPIYSTPLLAMSQIGGMFAHGNSIGGAFALLILGAGTNIGLFAWFGKTYGIKRVVIFYAMLFVTTVGLAYAIDKPLYPKGVDPAGHSHAFDVYTHPFDPGQGDMTFIAKAKAFDFWRSNEFGGTFILAFLIVVGILFTIGERFIDFEKWFNTKGENANTVDAILPGWFLGLMVVLGLIASSVLGCYLYYPPPEDLLSDMVIVNTDAVLCSKNKEWEAAEKWISFADDMSRRLEVGVFLRSGGVSEFKSTKAKIYRDKLDKLKEAVENRMEDRVEDLAMEVSSAYFGMSRAFKKK